MSSKKSSVNISLVVLLIILSFVTGGLGGTLGSQYYLSKNSSVTPNSNVKTVTEKITYVEESSLIAARKKVVPAVVSIIVLKEQAQVNMDPFFFNPFFFDPFFNGNQAPQPTQPKNENQPKPEKQPVGGGTGFIIKSDGLVVTNKHVVSDNTADYLIIMNDGAEYQGIIKSLDPMNDIAFLQMKPKEGSDKKQIANLPVVTLGDSDKLEIGQQVMAIGNALAQYQNTTTAGIISATGRNITAGDGQGMSENLTGLLQTDAAINPGNSGGPLVNLNGEVVGINTAIDKQANGIGFALPINDVKPVILSLEKNGKIIRPKMGVQYMILNEEKAKKLQIEVTHGALLVGNPEVGKFAVIPGGPADKAGLKMTDVILSVDGKDITFEYTLQDSIRNKLPGDKIKLKVWRSGKEIDVEVELGELKE